MFEVFLAFLTGLAISTMIWKFRIKYVITPKHDKLVNQVATQRVKTSRAVIKGQTLEHLVPWMSDFAYNPTDARFLGAPIDMIIFDGLFAGKLEKIILLEIKTGKSSLNSREQQIKKAVNEGRVEFQLIRVKEVDGRTDTTLNRLVE